MFSKRNREDIETEKITKRCSFCNKDEHFVRKLIAGPTVYICDECVAVCVGILADDRRVSPGKPGDAGVPTASVGKEVRPPSDAWCTFCGGVAELEMALLIENRALLCESCVSFIAAAAKEARRGEPASHE
jgi:hypothetical protein